MIEKRDTLKEKFNTGDKPTEADFVNLIDSNLNKVDDKIDRKLNGEKEFEIIGPLSVVQGSGEAVGANTLKAGSATFSDKLIVAQGGIEVTGDSLFDGGVFLRDGSVLKAEDNNGRQISLSGEGIQMGQYIATGFSVSELGESTEVLPVEKVVKDYVNKKVSGQIVENQDGGIDLSGASNFSGDISLKGSTLIVEDASGNIEKIKISSEGLEIGGNTVTAFSVSELGDSNSTLPVESVVKKYIDGKVENQVVLNTDNGISLEGASNFKGVSNFEEDISLKKTLRLKDSNNDEQISLSSEGIRIGGNKITAFSVSGLGDSINALPVEKVVKSYIDDKVNGQVLFNKDKGIDLEGDSNFKGDFYLLASTLRVKDSGNNEKLNISSLGIEIGAGTIKEFNEENMGESKNAVPSEYAVKNHVATQVAKTIELNPSGGISVVGSSSFGGEISLQNSTLRVKDDANNEKLNISSAGIEIGAGTIKEFRQENMADDKNTAPSELAVKNYVDAEVAKKVDKNASDGIDIDGASSFKENVTLEKSLLISNGKAPISVKRHSIPHSESKNDTITFPTGFSSTDYNAAVVGIKVSHGASSQTTNVVNAHMSKNNEDKLQINVVGLKAGNTCEVDVMFISNQISSNQ